MCLLIEIATLFLIIVSIFLIVTLYLSISSLLLRNNVTPYLKVAHAYLFYVLNKYLHN